MNPIAIIVAAFVPTFVGFIWYNPRFLGNAWMKASGVTEEKMKGANMAVIFGVSLFLSLLLSASVVQLSIHQIHIDSLLLGQPGFDDPQSELGSWLAGFKAQYKDVFRTFQHGSFHGIFAGFFFALPILGTNALFERKGFKYIAINAGYWIITLGIMGGIIGVWQ